MPTALARTGEDVLVCLLFVCLFVVVGMNILVLLLTSLRHTHTHIHTAVRLCARGCVAPALLLDDDDASDDVSSDETRNVARATGAANQRQVSVNRQIRRNQCFRFCSLFFFKKKTMNFT